MLFAKACLLLATAVAVNAHGKLASITGDNGATADGLAIIPTTPTTGSTAAIEADTTILGAGAAKNPASLTGCGKTNAGGVTNCASAAAISLKTSGGIVPTASTAGTVALTYHQVNADGAGPLTALVSTNLGLTWTAATIQGANVPGTNGKSSTTDTNFAVTVAIPAGTSCKGTVGTADGVCLVALANPAQGFGGSAIFTMPAAGTATDAATAAKSVGKAGCKRDVIDEIENSSDAFIKRDSVDTRQHKRNMRFVVSRITNFCHRDQD